MYSLTAIVEYKSFTDKEFWELLRTTHLQFDDEIVEHETRGEKIKFSDVGEYLNKQNHDLDIRINSGTISFGDIPTSKLARLDIENIVNNETEAQLWLSALLKDKRFIQACFYNEEYDTWQIMHDPKYYESHGKSYNHLPMKSNGLPYPLEQQVIDISNNPGRWEFKQGYIEAVASVMWLGELFWEKTGTKKADVLAADWLEKENIGRALKIKVQDKVFTSAEGQEADLQNKLRALLYS